MNTSVPRILVTGATGLVGGSVVYQLAKRVGKGVIAAARSPEKAARLGVPVVLLDYDREETLLPALQNVDSVFMVTGYTVDMLRQSKVFLDAAKRAGVKHIVHLGSPGDDETKTGHWGWHQFVERYIQWCGFSFTHLRPEIFMQNILFYGGSHTTVDGVIRHYIGDAKMSWVDSEDVAAVATEALQNPEKHNGRTYRLGYEDRSYAEIATILTEVVGQPFAYQPRPAREFLDKAISAGADYAYMHSVYLNYIDYEAGKIPGLEVAHEKFFEITGKKPKTWRAFAKENESLLRY